MRIGSLDLLFVLVAFLFAVLLLIEGSSASRLPQSIQWVTENAINGHNDLPGAVKERKLMLERTFGDAVVEVAFHANKEADEAESACQAANEAMLIKDSSWRAESDDFETEELPKCLHEWAVTVLPPKTHQYPVFNCKAPLAWSSACYGAKGLVATVTATALFPEPSNETSTRTITFPTCFSATKACTSSRTSADYLWTARLEQISAWCSNQTNPMHRCGDVKISSNFWQIASLPKIITIILAVIGSIAAIALIVVIIAYCRWRSKRQHDEAMERTLLLKLARKSALLQSRSSSYAPTDNESAPTLDQSSSSCSVSTIGTPSQSDPRQRDSSASDHHIPDTTPLLKGSMNV